VRVIEAKERKRVLAGFASGSTFSPRCQSNRTNRKDFLGSFDSREGDPQQISFLPLGRLAKEGKIERRE
jgi:hypothetical protein